MTKSDLQTIVDEVIAMRAAQRIEMIDDVRANGVALMEALRDAGASDDEIEIWIADCARTAAGVGGDERQVRIDYLTTLAGGMGFVLAVDHATRKILVRPASLRVN